MKSKPVKVSGKLFRYDFGNAMVEYIIKADEEMLKEEAEWKEKHHGDSLFNIDEDGYSVLSTAGLSVSNWKDADARKGYLIGWAAELEEEEEHMAEAFVRNELPHLMKETKK